MIKNSKGQILYGLHFYPGVAEYQEPGKDPYRVFLNEDTLRSMDPTFAGKPIFVEHVDEVDSNLDNLRKEADGWVIESFYNSADGKHWVKFIVVSERGEKAIRNGMRLSNAYVPKSFKDGGLWNGVQYAKEITGGEYEHLAIVRNPRYEESIIMTPDEFKQYNEENELELQKLKNSKFKKETQMKLNFFKKTKLENALDPELSVILPKSEKEITIAKLVNDADEKEMDKNSGLADMSHKVKMKDGSYCNVGELLAKHDKMSDEMEAMKAKKEDSEEKELDLKTEESPVKAEGDNHNDEKHPEDVVHDEDMDDKDAKKKALQLAEHEEKEIDAAKKKNEAKKKANALRYAHLNAFEEEEVAIVDFSMDQVARGKVRYGSS